MGKSNTEEHYLMDKKKELGKIIFKTSALVKKKK